MKSIRTVLYGNKGSIVVYDDNSASVREDNQPYIDIPHRKLSEYIEKLHIHSTSNGNIKLGVF